jgi:glycosyltransferase involved in cell wall biosynthesis
VVDVQVLLATYNGEKYLPELLESISLQDGVKVELIVSDDGSTDQTLEILRNFKSQNPATRIIDGPRLGPSQNFFFLLEQADAQFVAFADQDDIWMPNHLLESIERISTSREPTLSFAPLLEFRLNGKSTLWPRKLEVLSRLQMYIFENPARGCTQVFNRQLLEMAKKVPRSKALMHDSWLINLATITGSTVSGSKPEIYYRLHEQNYTLETRKRKAHFSFSYLKNHALFSLFQWKELVDSISKIPQNNSNILIDLQRPAINYFFRVMFTWPRLRMNVFENIALKFILITCMNEIRTSLDIKE